MTTHVQKTPATPCSECGAEPSEIASTPECNELARAVHKRGRTVHVFPVGGFFGLGAKPVPAIAMQILSVGEEGEARDAAHKTRAEQSKRAGEGKEAAQKDPSAHDPEQNLEALMRACRMVDDKGQPTPWAAFPGVNWMRRELSIDQQATLLALYDELKRHHGATKLELDEETVESIAHFLHAHLGEDIPESYLAAYPRWYLTHLCVLFAARLFEARKSVELLLQAREAWDVERAALEAELASARAELAAGPGDAPRAPPADA
jgi:hypothetical protein